MLSPGFTPELTDLFVIELPVAVGLGYLLDRKEGFEIAFAANALVLGLVKLVTDYSDVLDAPVFLAAIAGGAGWLLVATGVLERGSTLRLMGFVLGSTCVLMGLLKLQDFYDPLDLLLADTLIVTGVALWLLGPAAPSTAPESYRERGAG